MSETNIPILPDVCLWLIFKYLPTNDLIKGIGHVCTHWRLLLDPELLARSTLVLCTKDFLDEIKYSLNEHYDHLLERIRKNDGSPWTQLPTAEQIKFDWLSFDFHAWTFPWWNMPNITDLYLVCGYHFRDVTPSIFVRFIQLIRLWSANLITLKLKIRFGFERNGTEPEVHQMLVSLFDELNNMPNLRHLYLDVFVARIVPMRFSDISQFRFLSYLHTFCIETSPQIYHTDECLVTSLLEYGRTNNNLKICTHESIERDQILRIDRQLGRKFSQISPFWWKDCGLSARFCARFTTVTSLSLNIYWTPREIQQMTQNLRLLPYLVTLKLSCIFSGAENENPIDTPEPVDYPQVHSVRLLVLDITTQSHCDTSKLHFANIFPNVQVLHFWHRSLKCTVCDYKIQRDNSYKTFEERCVPQRSTILECMRLARAPFRECANLHTIEHNDNPLDNQSWGQKLLISIDQL